MALGLLRTTRHPERVITTDPDAWYRGDPKVMGQENYDEWRTAMRDSAVVRGMLEDYRAGLTVDCRDERADRAAGRKLRQPLLVLWSTRDDLEDLYGDPRVIWRDWADDVGGHGIDAATTWQNWPRRHRRGTWQLPRMNPRQSAPVDRSGCGHMPTDSPDHMLRLLHGAG